MIRIIEIPYDDFESPMNSLAKVLHEMKEADDSLVVKDNNDKTKTIEISDISKQPLDEFVQQFKVEEDAYRKDKVQLYYAVSIESVKDVPEMKFQPNSSLMNYLRDKNIRIETMESPFVRTVAVGWISGVDPRKTYRTEYRQTLSIEVEEALKEEEITAIQTNTSTNVTKKEIVSWLSISAKTVSYGTGKTADVTNALEIRVPHVFKDTFRNALSRIELNHGKFIPKGMASKVGADAYRQEIRAHQQNVTDQSQITVMYLANTQQQHPELPSTTIRQFIESNDKVISLERTSSTTKDGRHIIVMRRVDREAVINFIDESLKVYQQHPELRATSWDLPHRRGGNSTAPTSFLAKCASLAQAQGPTIAKPSTPSRRKSPSILSNGDFPKLPPRPTSRKPNPWGNTTTPTNTSTKPKSTPRTDTPPTEIDSLSKQLASLTKQVTQLQQEQAQTKLENTKQISDLTEENDRKLAIAISAAIAPVLQALTQAIEPIYKHLNINTTTPQIQADASTPDRSNISTPRHLENTTTGFSPQKKKSRTPPPDINNSEPNG
jgi:hypothetical protein